MELATRIAEIAERVLAGSRRQLALSVVANATADAPAADPATTIATTERKASEILAEWRAAERAALAAEAGSVEEHEERARADRLRDEYREAFNHGRRHLNG